MGSLDPWNWQRWHSAPHTRNKNIPAKHLLDHLGDKKASWCRGWHLNAPLPAQIWLQIKEHPTCGRWGWNIWWMIYVISLISHEYEHWFPAAQRARASPGCSEGYFQPHRRRELAAGPTSAPCCMWWNSWCDCPPVCWRGTCRLFPPPTEGKRQKKKCIGGLSRCFSHDAAEA